MDPRTICQNLARITREEGLRSAIDCAVGRALTRFREWKYGINTEGVIYLKDLGVNDVDCNEYCPVDYDDFNILMDSIDIKAGQDVFLDFGAGLGRAIVLASKYPFKRVIGVELSAQLSAVAKRNISQNRRNIKRTNSYCPSIDVVTCDAALYEVPDDASVIYFNNPFVGEVLERVLSNIRRSLLATPRAIELICNLPSECPFDTQIRRQQWLSLERELTLKNGRRGLIFVQRN